MVIGNYQLPKVVIHLNVLGVSKMFTSTADFSIPDRRNLSNIECEQSLLGKILLDGSIIHDLSQKLPSEAFSVNRFKLIYETMLSMTKQDIFVDLMTLTNFLTDKGLLVETGGRSQLAQLLDESSAHNYDGVADLILEKYTRRKLASLASEIELKATDTETPLSWLLEKVEGQVLSLTQQRKKEGKSYWQRIDEVAFERLCKELEQIEEIENSAQRDWAFKKLSRKWKFSSKKELLDFHAKWLDSQTQSKTYSAKEYFQKYGMSDQEWVIPGFIPSQSVVVLYADGGVGKTRLSFSMAKKCVEGGSFAYQGTEFDPMNVLLIETDQGPRNTAKLLEMQDFLDDRFCHRLTICDDWSVSEFGRLRSMLKKHQPKLVIVDSLTSISVSSCYSENDTEYARPLVRIRHIAKEYGCSFLIIHHSNAGGDLRGSRAIRNTVDEVWKFTNEVNEVEKFNKLTIEKTRSRGPGTYKFTYDDDSWSWQFAGRLEDSNIPGGNVSTNNMQQCLNFLQQNMGVAYEAVELAHTLGLNKDSVRRDLKRASMEGLCNCGRSTTNRRSLVYYIGNRINSTEDSTESKENIITDQLIRTDQIADQIAKPVTVSITPLSDQTDQSDQTPDQLNNQEKNVNTLDQIDHFDQIASKPLINKDLGSDQPSDQLNDQLITCNISLQESEESSITEVVQDADDLSKEIAMMKTAIANKDEETVKLFSDLPELVRSEIHKSLTVTERVWLREVEGQESGVRSR